MSICCDNSKCIFNVNGICDRRKIVIDELGYCGSCKSKE